MIKWNECDRCPYYSSYIPYWSDDGFPVEDCGAGLNPEDGCKHNRLVRWILFKIRQREMIREDQYIMSLLEQEEEKDL